MAIGDGGDSASEGWPEGGTIGDRHCRVGKTDAATDQQRVRSFRRATIDYHRQHVAGTSRGGSHLIPTQCLSAKSSCSGLERSMHQTRTAASYRCGRHPRSCPLARTERIEDVIAPLGLRKRAAPASRTR